MKHGITGFVTLVMLLWCGSALSAEQDIARFKDRLPRLIEELLFAPAQESKKLLHSDYESKDSLFWVDWGEEELYMVQACSMAIGTDSLIAELDSSEQPKLVITYKDRRFNFPLDMSPTAQHTTLVRLNDVLSPDYQIRWIWDSDGSDTLAFVVLRLELWRELEDALGSEVVDTAFFQFTDQTDIFSGTGMPKRPKP